MDDQVMTEVAALRVRVQAARSRFDRIAGHVANAVDQLGSPPGPMSIRHICWANSIRQELALVQQEVADGAGTTDET